MSSLVSLQNRWHEQLQAADRSGRLRSLKVPNGVDFSSNDYLSFADQSLADGHLPCSGKASRLLSGHHRLWVEVESALAGWHQSDAALVMNSGYVANEGLLSTVIRRGDWVASDEFNHASIIDGLKLSRAERQIYRHLDLDQLESLVQSASKTRPAGRELFVVTESLFSMDGDVAPLRAIVEIAERFDAQVIVDEAHATGCFGSEGSGLVDSLGIRDRLLATIHSGGKALGVQGAYICGSRTLKELLINSCRHFIFTTALPPAVAQWWLVAIERAKRAQQRRTQLHANAEYFRRQLSHPAPGAHYVVPIVMRDERQAVRLAERAQRMQWDLRAIRPPTVPPGTSRIRISIHAGHEQSVLSEVAEALSSWIDEVS